jgi:hypothetical protein
MKQFKLIADSITSGAYGVSMLLTLVIAICMISPSGPIISNLPIAGGAAVAGIVLALSAYIVFLATWDLPYRWVGET